jgi:hypothetical protein
METLEYIMKVACEDRESHQSQQIKNLVYDCKNLKYLEELQKAQSFKLSQLADKMITEYFEFEG